MDWFGNLRLGVCLPANLSLAGRKAVARGGGRSASGCSSGKIRPAMGHSDVVERPALRRPVFLSAATSFCDAVCGS